MNGVSIVYDFLFIQRTYTLVYCWMLCACAFVSNTNRQPNLNKATEEESWKGEQTQQVFFPANEKFDYCCSSAEQFTW